MSNNFPFNQDLLSANNGSGISTPNPYKVNYLPERFASPSSNNLTPNIQQIPSNPKVPELPPVPEKYSNPKIELSKPAKKKNLFSLFFDIFFKIIFIFIVFLLGILFSDIIYDSVDPTYKYRDLIEKNINIDLFSQSKSVSSECQILSTNTISKISLSYDSCLLSKSSSSSAPQFIKFISTKDSAQYLIIEESTLPNKQACFTYPITQITKQIYRLKTAEDTYMYVNVLKTLDEEKFSETVRQVANDTNTSAYTICTKNHLNLSPTENISLTLKITDNEFLTISDSIVRTINF